jgi:hypothetical protein
VPLPNDISLAELRQLLGVTRQRVAQLETDGVVTRTTRGRYAMGSIRRDVDWLRKGNEGPARWNRARTRLAEEKALTYRLNLIVLWAFIVATMAIVITFLALDRKLTPEQRALTIQQSSFYP